MREDPRSREPQTHLVRRLESQRRVERPALVARMEDQRAEAPCAGPCEDLAHELPRESLAPMPRLREHVQDVPAGSRRVRRGRRPIEDPDARPRRLDRRGPSRAIRRTPRPRASPRPTSGSPRPSRRASRGPCSPSPRTFPGGGGRGPARPPAGRAGSCSLRASSTEQAAGVFVASEDGSIGDGYVPRPLY